MLFLISSCHSNAFSRRLTTNVCYIVENVSYYVVTGEQQTFSGICAVTVPMTCTCKTKPCKWICRPYAKKLQDRDLFPTVSN